MKSTCLVLTFNHPYNATTQYATEAVNYFSLVGYNARSFILGGQNITDLPNHIDPSLELVIIIGTPPFDIKINDEKYLWEYFLENNIKVTSILLDQIPYCLRISGYKKYLKDRKNYPNERMICFEKNISEVLSQYCEKSVIYKQAYANLHHRISKDRSSRWFFWGSIDAGLGREYEESTLKKTIQKFNIWGLNELSIDNLCESFMNTNDFFTYNTLSQHIGISTSELFHDTSIHALCAIDSKLKTDRRIKLLTSLTDYPIDVYGKGWDRYINDSHSNLKLKTANPDLNSTFSLYCQEYSGLVNIDPNWGYGTNERVSTAIYYGLPVLTNRNYSFMGKDSIYQYTLCGSTLQKATEKAFSSEKINFTIDKEVSTSIDFFNNLFIKC